MEFVSAGITPYYTTTRLDLEPNSHGLWSNKKKQENQIHILFIWSI